MVTHIPQIPLHPTHSYLLCWCYLRYILAGHHHQSQASSMDSQADNHYWQLTLSHIHPLTVGKTYLCCHYYCSFLFSNSYHGNTTTCPLQYRHSTLPPIVPMSDPCSHLLFSSIHPKPCYRNLSPHDFILRCYILSFSLLSLWTWGSSWLMIQILLLPILVVLLLLMNFCSHSNVPRFHDHFWSPKLCTV